MGVKESVMLHDSKSVRGIFYNHSTPHSTFILYLKSLRIKKKKKRFKIKKKSKSTPT